MPKPLFLLLIVFLLMIKIFWCLELESVMVYTKLESFPKGKTCSFCNTRIVDTLTLGEIYKTSDITVHYFCLVRQLDLLFN